MSKVLNVIIIVGVLAIVLIVAFVGYDILSKSMDAGGLTVLSPTGETETRQNAELASDFTVYDTEGNPRKLSDFRGKPVVLNFWASWCPPCKAEMPDFEAAYKTYGEQIQFVMVNLTDGYQETKQSATDYLAGTNFTFPVYFDTDMDAAMTYGITSVPATYFIDAEGYLIAYGQGMLSAENLQQGIDRIQ